MSFLEEIFGKAPAADGYETCPNCGWPLNDTGDDRFECSNPKCHCVAFRVNGEIMDAFDPRRRGGAAGKCERCQQSLSGGSLTLPWEDGNNSYAYVRCPHCGKKTSVMDMAKTNKKEEAHMKKILGILLAAVITLTSLTALGETIDFSGYNDAALIELLASLQQEIADRHIEKSASLPEGAYIVGKDIPSGAYDISVIYKGSMWMDVYIVADGGNGDIKQDFTVFAKGEYGDGTGSFHVDLIDGDLLKCTAPITLTISTGVLFR